MRNLIVSTLMMTLVVSLVVGCHEASEEGRAGRLTSESGKDSVTTAAAAEYSLPVRLGSSSEEVRKVLGTPNEFFSPPASNGMTLGYFYSSGIVARFDHDTLFGITLNTNSVPKGFLIYSGKVVNGVKLSDAKATIFPEPLGACSRHLAHKKRVLGAAEAQSRSPDFELGAALKL